MRISLKTLLKRWGQPYSEQLGIDLESGREGEIFKWFLAAILFGKPIQERVAATTYRLFALRKVTSPESIERTGWDGLVELLDMGGYVRYDFSTATKLLSIVAELKKVYGSLTALHKLARNAADLESRLQKFKGIGPVTTNIFLRELRVVWPKADPEPAELVKTTAKKLGIRLESFKRKSKEFIRLECALFRIGKAMAKGKKVDLDA